MLIFWLVSFCVTAFAQTDPSQADGGKLFLTPLIEAGEIDKARNLAKVPPLLGTVTSYSGYLTVNKSCESNLFFWFFPSEKNDSDTPLAVWLQGGPGATSLFGLFSELGPFELTPSNDLKLRKYSWHRLASYIFIDNPVGTGYSFTGKEECYSRDQVEIGRNLLNALKQFLKMFPEYKSSPLFVTGESYAGKYVPALSYAIHSDKDPQNKINLQGLSMGNGFADPYNQLRYSDYLYQIGLLDSRGREELRAREEYCRTQIKNGNWLEATRSFDSVLNGDLYPHPTFFQNVTGFKFYFNYLFTDGQPTGDVKAFVTKDEVRRSIHVGDAAWQNETTVLQHLREDVMKSVKPWLEELLEHYRVLVYNGQLDIIVAYPLTENSLQRMNWSSSEEYKVAKRYPWRVEKEIAGYVKTAGNLTEIMVRNAGHMVPMDQPKWAFDMIYRFLKGKPFH